MQRSVRVNSRRLKSIDTKINLDLPSNDVLSAVESKGGRVTAADVASSAGMKISDASRELNKLASYTGGDLEVSKDGDILYAFSRNVRADMLQRSAGLRARQLFEKIWPALAYLTRITFGVGIFVSLAIIGTAIVVISSSSSKSDDDDRRGSRSSSSFGYGGGYDGYGSPYRSSSIFDVFYYSSNIFDVFYYRPYGYYAPYGEGDEMGLLESIFSYVFGDGDPNSNRDQESLKACAELIRENGGVVIAEQLAPLLSPETGPVAKKDGIGSGVVDESFMFDVLVALDGRPEVLENGDIVYVFENLGATTEDDTARQSAVSLRKQRSIMSMIGDSIYGGTDKEHNNEKGIFPEIKIPFSLASDGNLLIAGILGVVNLVGAVYLGSLLRDPMLIYQTGPEFAALITKIFPFLLTYAIGYNVIPLLRGLANKRKNEEIEDRNFLRALWYDRQSTTKVQDKIRNSKRFRLKQRVINREDIEYTTAKDLDQQGLGRDEKDLRDFDAALESTTEKQRRRQKEPEKQE
eukprot:CAMPEP_0197520880 /NCGR_PEP_ID=MMETSP1318-20131121/6204_1 /TAXON_ID=552666 /ORGANISM="Partenskyella glossopodia, Strain RCC365" /LENGTH=519 /DNA_ID=CAMNT_0043072637 /DNA_START=345 /DNA_END=1904 /DNA_ORIENTATION=+